MKKQLIEILDGIEVLKTNGDLHTLVSSVEHDSRKVTRDALFVALPGLKVDGHAFLPNAAGQGASAAIVSEPVDRGSWKAIVQVPDTRAALAACSVNFHGRPSLNMHLVGITGTNGKTTLTYLCESMVKASGGVPGVIGTINARFQDTVWESTHTTPEASDLQKWFSEMQQKGVTHVLMEVSSHALDLRRVYKSDFQVAVFTNLSRDHLDYHGDMDRYAAAKSQLFSRELTESRAENKVAVVNDDDPRAPEMIRGWRGRVITFGCTSRADVHPEGEFRSGLDGISADLCFPGGRFSVQSQLPGVHNLYNILAAVAIGSALELSSDAISTGIESCRRVPGRLERVDSGGGPVVFVDYAHTDVALANVLKALRPLTRGRLVVVFGCGGDRDKGKRPMMGAAVARGSDLAIVTSDNPRTEDPQGIIEAILPGMLGESWHRTAVEELKNQGRHSFAVVPNRREAIRWAIRIARSEDVVLIAGKGHEKVQIVGNTKSHFDDREEAIASLSSKAGKEWE